MYRRLFVLVPVLVTLTGADLPSFTKNAAFLDKCLAHDSINEIANCTALKISQYIRRADKIQVLQILPGVTLRKNDSVREFLPEIPNNASQAIDLIYDATSNFISSRILNIKLPLSESKNIGRAFEEGRGKMKKMMGSFLLGLGGKMMTMIPMMFGVVLLLTAKALLVGKLAFAISVVLFLGMFFRPRIVPFSPGGGSFGIGIPPTYGVPTTYGGTNIGGNSFGGTNSIGGWNTAQYPYARSIDDNDTETN